MRIHATLAHIGVFSEDGDNRILTPDGHFTARLPIPITYLYNTQVHVVGQFDEVHDLTGTETRQIIAAGTIYDPVPGRSEAWLTRVAAYVRNGSIWPELDMADLDIELTNTGVWIHAGRIASVRLGFNPAWHGLSVTPAPTGIVLDDATQAAVMTEYKRRTQQ